MEVYSETPHLPADSTNLVKHFLPITHFDHLGLHFVLSSLDFNLITPAAIPINIHFPLILHFVSLATNVIITKIPAVVIIKIHFPLILHFVSPATDVTIPKIPAVITIMIHCFIQPLIG